MYQYTKQDYRDEWIAVAKVTAMIVIGMIGIVYGAGALASWITMMLEVIG